MVKRIISIGALLIMFFSFCACWEDEYANDQVIVKVHEDFRQKFNDEEFTIEDFQWDNVEEIVYYHGFLPEQGGSFTVYLKKHGKKYVLAAVEHFKTLEFVEKARPEGRSQIA